MAEGESEFVDQPLVTIVIINYNGRKWLNLCLTSIKNLRYRPHEVILVDNASSDTSVQYAAKHFPWIRIVKNTKNFGYAEGCNIGARCARGEIIAFLNQDIKVDPYWLSHLVSTLKQGNVGACCGKLFDYEGERILFPMESDLPYPSECQEIRMVYGAAFATRKDVIEKIGLFDPKFFMYYEEIDWSWRLRLANYKCIYVPEATAYHWVGGSDTTFERIVYLSYRNRIRTLIKNCELETLLFFVPLIVLEIGGCLLSLLYSDFAASWFSESPRKPISGLALVKGCIKGIAWNIINIRDTMRERAKIQKLRVILDKKLKPKEQDFFYQKFLKILGRSHTQAFEPI